MDDRLTVAKLFEELGFAVDQGNLDEAVRWALIELKLRRERFQLIEGFMDIMDSWPDRVFEVEPFPAPPWTVESK